MLGRVVDSKTYRLFVRSVTVCQMVWDASGFPGSGIRNGCAALRMTLNIAAMPSTWVLGRASRFT